MTEPVNSRLSLLQHRISITTWAITLLLSLRGLFDFYGMKEKGSIELIVGYITEPVAQLFQFGFLRPLADIPAITVAFAVISLLLISYMVQAALLYADFRNNRTRELVAQQMILTVK